MEFVAVPSPLQRPLTQMISNGMLPVHRFSDEVMAHEAFRVEQMTGNEVKEHFVLNMLQAVTEVIINELVCLVHRADALFFAVHAVDVLVFHLLSSMLHFVAVFAVAIPSPSVVVLEESPAPSPLHPISIPHPLTHLSIQKIFLRFECLESTAFSREMT